MMSSAAVVTPSAVNLTTDPHCRSEWGVKRIINDDNNNDDDTVDTTY